MNYWRCKHSIRCPKGKREALGEGLYSRSRTEKHRRTCRANNWCMSILHKQNSKTSIHPKLKTRWWKVARILLNTKLTITLYSGLLLYFWNNWINQAKTREEELDTGWQLTRHSWFLPPYFGACFSPFSLLSPICLLFSPGTRQV